MMEIQLIIFVFLCHPYDTVTVIQTDNCTEHFYLT